MTSGSRRQRPRSSAAADLAELDEQQEITAGRLLPYTQLGDWVALSGISDHAKALYWHLAMHVNQKRGDGQVWPTRPLLAEWAGFSRAASIDTYIEELLALGAIDKFQRTYDNGMRRRNVYVVHFTPPDGYQGVESLSEFYASRRNELGSSSAPNSGKFSKNTGQNVVRLNVRPEVRSAELPEVRSSGHRDMRPAELPDVRPAEPRSVRPIARPSVRPAGQKQDELQQDEIPTTSSTRPATEPLTPNSVATGPEEGEVDLDLKGKITAMLAAIPIPPGKRAPGTRSAKLRETADRCYAILSNPDHYQLTLPDLRKHLSRDLDTVNSSIVGCWLYRLADDELPDPRPAGAPQASAPPAEAAPAVLGACDACGAREGEAAPFRVIERADGKHIKCPACHPQAANQLRPAVPGEKRTFHDWARTPTDID
ncbi:helix-turn-helix domain-containing protein (plasmid) [Amycolatopsis sp. FU40]|uniref:helix-turn-helix domain-containing protein n=1 Tax=Amycolatopsis sp. FU40 TaxID=2914159 RepID=UPI001F2ED8B9|nr:helix-turn-helix domain-containing protein [Amycolatopsis sp. FU40]UKD50839.1 helix-turn-helix domain-containing protein [Amycolatopsis sp. FU40]